MRRNARIKFQGNRLIIAAATFVMTVFAFLSGAFLALQNSQSPPSTMPKDPVASPSSPPKPASTTRQPKKLQAPVAKPRTLPPPNSQNKKDPNEDRD